MENIHHSISVRVVDNAKEAIKEGFMYRPPVFKPIRIEKVVVVKHGTESGGSTVDFVLQDEKGQKYVFLITGQLLRSIPTEF